MIFHIIGYPGLQNCYDARLFTEQHAIAAYARTWNILPEDAASLVWKELPGESATDLEARMQAQMSRYAEAVDSHSRAGKLDAMAAGR